MAARQDTDPDIGPIMRWKRAGNDWPRWEDISPESREAKVLWRQWERLYLVGGVLHRRFHELEGQGWRPQLVVPADRRSSLLQRFHGGMIGAHLGTACTLVLAEQGFYWPGMQADVSRICNECDCAMLKKRRGRREPLHQYIVGVPTLSPRQGTNTASWWDATFQNGSIASPSRTRRPERYLGSWYTRLWPGTEVSESCIVTRARILGRR